MHLAHGRVRPWSLHTAGYLAVILVGSVVTEAVLRLTPDWRLGPLPAAAVVVAVYVPVAVWLWWVLPWGRWARGLLRSFLLLVIALWAYAMALTAVRGEELGVTGVIVPLTLAMVLAKPPSAADARAAGDLFALSLVGASALTVVLEAVDAIPSWYELDPRRWLEGDLSRYWLPLDEPLGLLGRWAGPFVHPNLAGTVGAFLVVFGLTRRGWRLPVFAVSGLIVLLLTGSRTAQLAAAAGVAVLAAAWWVRRPGGLSGSVKLVIVAVPVVVLTAAVVLVNPSLTGRTEMWPSMLRLWATGPVVGVGQTGFNDGIATGTLDEWVVHAHNLWLDAGVRFGVIGFLLVVAITLVAVLSTGAGARAGQSVGLALVSAVVVAGLTDVSVNWRYLTAPTAAFVLAVLMGREDPAT